MKSNVVFDKMYFVFKSNIGFIENNILIGEIFYYLISNVLLSRPERDEEAVKKRKQEKKKISAEAKVHNYTVCQYEAKVRNQTVWVMCHVSLYVSMRPRYKVDEGNYQEGQGSQLNSMSQGCQYVCQYEAKVHSLGKKPFEPYSMSHTSC